MGTKTVPVISKFQESLIDNKVAMSWTMSNIDFCSTQRWVTPASVVRSCWNFSPPPKEKWYSSVFRENRCPPPPKPVCGGNFSHEAMTLKIRSRSPKSNKILILFDLYRLANLVPSNGPWDDMQTNTFWLNFGPLSLTVTLQIRSRSPKPIQLFIMSKCCIHANLVKIRQLVYEILSTQALFGSNLAV